jgi:hypothetical protein
MNLTVLVLVITAVLLAVYDVYIIVKKGKYESISAHIIRGSKQYPLVVLLFGILLGHLFWSMNTADIYKDIECSKIK